MLVDIYAVGFIITTILFWKLILRILSAEKEGEGIDFFDVIGMTFGSLTAGMAWPFVASAFLIVIVADAYAKYFNARVKNGN